MKNNKIKKSFTIAGIVILFLAILFGVWGYGVNVGARAERRENEKAAAKKYTIEDMYGAWIGYEVEEDGNVKLNSLSYYDKGQDENQIYSWSLSHDPYESKSQFIDVDTLLKESPEPTYVNKNINIDSQNNMITYTFDIYGSDPGEKSFYFSYHIGRGFKTISQISKNSNDEKVPRATLYHSYRIPKVDGKYYIDINEIKELSKDSLFNNLNSIYSEK